jgi:hypothetical protein
MTTACSGSTNLLVTPKASFTNVSSNGSHYLASVKVSNIPASCASANITISVYSDSSSVPNVLYGSTTSISVLDANNTFYLDQSYSSNTSIASSSASCTVGGGTCYSFTITFTAPSLLTSNVDKIVLQSGVNTFTCFQSVAILCTLKDVTVANASLQGLAWASITSSSDGKKLVAAVGSGGIYTSTNSGLTWSKTAAPNGAWTQITSSADGTKLVVAPYSGNIYFSMNSGLTWTAASPNDYFTGIASSSDGTYVTAITNRSAIYISSNSGSTWTKLTTASGRWQDITVSSSGQYQAAIDTQNVSGNVFTSSDWGATWTSVTPTGAVHNIFYTAIASSSDGSFLVTTNSNPGGIYTSTDYGVNWVKSSISGSWSLVASNSDGTRLFAIPSTKDLYLSLDFGVTWTNQTATGIGHNLAWSWITTSGDGSLVAGVVSLGNVYVSQ